MSHVNSQVQGASGITGWAITNLIIQGYPSPNTFGSVTALTNRPLTREAAQWPESSKLDIVSGINIMTDKGQAGLEDELKAKVKHLPEITHVYFFGKEPRFVNSKMILTFRLSVCHGPRWCEGSRCQQGDVVSSD